MLNSGRLYVKQKVSPQQQGGESEQEPLPQEFQNLRLKRQPQEFQTKPEIQEPKFMAQNTDSGIPYYGQGDFKSWARSTFAKVFDPNFFLSNVNNPEVTAQYKDAVKETQQRIEKFTKWDKWGKDLFGITSEEIAQTSAAINAELAASDNKTGTQIAQATGVLKRGIGQSVMTGLGLFSLFDYGKRKDVALRQADAELFKQTESYKNVQNSFAYKMADKFGAAEFVFGRGVDGKAGVWLAENPIIGGGIMASANAMRSWVQRAYIVGDPKTREIALDTYEKYWRGSSMAYTMVADAAKMNEFNKEVDAGADPELAAINNSNFWTELGGSILNDPTTYMGATLMKGIKIPFSGGRAIGIVEGKIAVVPWEKLLIMEIPTIGEVFGIGAKARNIAAGQDVVRAITKGAGDEVSRIESIVKSIDGWDNLGDNAQAVAKLDEHANKIVGMVDDFAKNLESNRVPNTKILDTASKKASEAFRSITNATRMILTKGGTIDERLEVMRAIRTMVSGNPAQRKAAVLMVTKDLGNLAVSDGVLQLGVMLSRLEKDEDIVRLATKAGGNVLENEPLIKKLDEIAKAFYPSMDEMADAAKKIDGRASDIEKAKGVIDDLTEKIAVAGQQPKVVKKLEKELEKARKAFDSEFGKEVELKALYDQIPDIIKKGREGLRAYEQFPIIGANRVKQYMNTVYLALRPAQTMKQIQSQTSLIAMDLGLFDAIDIFARTAVTAFKQSWTEDLLAKNIDEIQKVLGFKPARFTRGMAASGEVVQSKGFTGMLKVTQNLDELMSSEIILRTARKEMAKIINKPEIFDFARLSQDFSKDETNLLYRLLVENTGDTRKAAKEFERLTKKGTFDTWRYIEMPEKTKKFLQDSKIYEKVIEIQKTAKNQGDFVKGIDDLVNTVVKKAKSAAAQMPPVIEADAPPIIREQFLLAQELKNQGLIGEVQQSVFNNKVNAYRYMRKAIVNGVQELATQMRAMGISQLPEFVQAEREFNAAFIPFIKMGEDTTDITRHISTVLNDVGKSVDEIIDLIHTDVFNLEELTGKSLDELRMLDLKSFKKTVWPEYFKQADAMYENSQMKALDGMWSAIEAYAKKFKMEIPQLLEKNPRATEYMQAVAQYRAEAQTWENFAKYASQNINEIANAYGVPTANAKGLPLDKQLINTLNKHLPEGMTPFSDKADAESRLDDVRLALSKMQETKEPAVATAADKISEMMKNVSVPQAERRVGDRRVQDLAVDEERRIADQRLTFDEYIDKYFHTWSDDEKKMMLKKTATDVTTGIESPYAHYQAGRRAPQGWATVQVDANGLGALNDKFGHPAGDALLKGIGDKINEIIKGKGRAFRTGGDEIELWIENPKLVEELSGKIDKEFSEVVLTFEDNNFRYRKKGFSISYGTGRTKAEQEASLSADKLRRETTGQRHPIKGRLAESVVDVSPPEAIKAGEGGVPEEAVLEQIRNTPPVVSPGTATNSQALYKNVTDAGFISDLRVWADEVSASWGKQLPADRLTGARKQSLDVFMSDYEKKMVEAKGRITGVSEAVRDNILLSYDKNYGDIAGAYFKPYHYWQTHQTMNTFARFLDHPSWANGYLKYKQAMANDNKELPEWWRYNLEIKHLPGIDLENPIYVNFESAINPIYDLTGADFNDPYKRVDWASRAIDDLGQTGGSFTPIIQWATALHLYEKGEEEAGNRWIGRVLGQTGQATKALLTKLGFDVSLGKFIQHNEIDPAVNFLMGGMDPQERKRVGRAMAAMIKEGLRPEIALQAMNEQSGEIWDEAVRRAVEARSGTELISYFAGVNWKPRTQQDAEIDMFYKEYWALRGQRDMMSPDQYKVAWDNMREQYPYMDSLLLSGKNTDDRNSAYTYNILSRIPPGMQTEVANAVGLTREETNYFYDNKGDLSKLSPADRKLFIDKIVKIGTFMAIPQNSNRREWTQARIGYSEINKQLQSEFGDDILTKIDDYLDADTEAEKERIAELNPEIRDALQIQNYSIATDPLLSKYYGGMYALERYYKSEMESNLEEKYGKELILASKMYKDATLDEDKKLILSQNPRLRDYWDEKSAYSDEIMRRVTDFGKKLPEVKIETYGEPQQEAIQSLTNPQPKRTFQEWNNKVGDSIINLIVDFRNGKNLSYSAEKLLDKYADRLGYKDRFTMMRDILMSMP
jgi:GGDEF domain-containing protein/methyl-accepting chemotaxis protein